LAIDGSKHSGKSLASLTQGRGFESQRRGQKMTKETFKKLSLTFNGIHFLFSISAFFIFSLSRQKYLCTKRAGSDQISKHEGVLTGLLLGTAKPTRNKL
jgi:hypothetical protein